MREAGHHGPDAEGMLFCRPGADPLHRDHIRSLPTHTRAAGSDNSAHATTYRWRRHHETPPATMPLQSLQKVGDHFRVPLIAT